MAMNSKVQAAKAIMADAYFNGKGFEEAREHFFEVLEQEIQKNPEDCRAWLEWEIPVDCLLDSIHDNWRGWKAQWVQEVLDDYLRITALCTKYSLSFGKPDMDLIEETKKGIAQLRKEETL